MRPSKLVCGVVAMSGVLLLGALALTSAAPAKKAPAKPAVHKAVAGKSGAAAGKAVYEKQNCSMCHAIGAKGGKMGPALTHIGKSWTVAKIKAEVRDPKKLNPKSMMPAYGKDKISDPDLTKLAAYLASLK